MLRDDDVDQLTTVSEWLRRLDRVELFTEEPEPSAARRLVGWLASDESLRHIHWQHQSAW